MRWIKHLTATRRDEKIARLIAGFGYRLYGIYWAVLETVAETMKGRDCSVSYPLTIWSHLLSLRGSHIRKALGDLEVTGLVTVKWDANDVQVTIPNLLKFKDEYSRKFRQTPDKLPSKDREAKTDTEADPSVSKKQKQKAHGAAQKPAPSPLAFEGQVLKITEREDRALGKAFPWVSRPADYAKMDSWLVANSERRIRKFGRFAYNWVAKIPKPAEWEDSGERLQAPKMVEWTCLNCGRKNQTKAGFVKVCDGCKAPD